jgi:sigma-70-like protein
VIVLHHLVGLPVEEVARELRLAPGTVKSRLARGRAAMAGSLDVVAAGLILPARLTGRSGDLPRPTTTPPTDVAGAATVGGYWLGKTDASVFLEEGVTPARRQAIRERIERLDVVDLGTPEQFKRLLLALCRPGKSDSVAKSDSGKLRCMDGVDSVVEDAASLKPLLVGRFWFAVADVTVALPEGTSDARRREVQARRLRRHPARPGAPPAALALSRPGPARCGCGRRGWCAAPGGGRVARRWPGTRPPP